GVARDIGRSTDRRLTVFPNPGKASGGQSLERRLREDPTDRERACRRRRGRVSDVEDPGAAGQDEVVHERSVAVERLGAYPGRTEVELLRLDLRHESLELPDEG